MHLKPLARRWYFRNTQHSPPAADTLSMLSFQKLDVYRCAIEFLALVLEIIKDIPRGHAVVVDQLKRAALAIPLNIAEGAGRMGQGEAAHSYAIARGEAMECASALDVLQLLKAISEERHRRACELLERLVAMLTKMCR